MVSFERVRSLPMVQLFSPCGLCHHVSEPDATRRRTSNTARRARRRERSNCCRVQNNVRTSSFSSRGLASTRILFVLLVLLVIDSIVSATNQVTHLPEQNNGGGGFLENLWEKLKQQLEEHATTATRDDSKQKGSSRRNQYSSSGQQRGRRRVMYEHTVQSHYSTYLSSEEQEETTQPSSSGNTADAVEQQKEDGDDDDMILETSNGCLWYNEGRDSYWTYRWCPGESLEQMHIVVSKKGDWIQEATHTMGTVFTEHDKNSEYMSSWGRTLKLVAHDFSQESQLQFFHGGDGCAFTTKSTGKTKRRRAVVVLESCPPHVKSKRILRVEEPFACDYVLHACYLTQQEKVMTSSGETENDLDHNAEKDDLAVEEAAQAIHVDSESDVEEFRGPSKPKSEAMHPNEATTGFDTEKRPAEKKTDTRETKPITGRKNTEPPPESDTTADMERVLRNYLHQSGVGTDTDRTTPLHIGFAPFPPSRKEDNLKLIRKMFQHAYDSYMYHAFPASEIKPLTCKPGTFHLVRLPALTLIDTLDTLVVMQNFTEFARGVERVRELHDAILDTGGLFAVNQNVSVFETNIRVLGGLLSAHQLAVAYVDNQVLERDVWDEKGNVRFGGLSAETQKLDEQPIADSQICPIQRPMSDDGSGGGFLFSGSSMLDFELQALQQTTGMEQCINNSTTQTGRRQHQINKYWKYDGILLQLARDLGERLLPAFKTKTGIPYGTVNLLHGIPPGETTVASLAGGGTLTLEFELLSRMTGDENFGRAAKLASRALWMRRSPKLNLLGKHIDIHRGEWTETLSGIGSNSDSFYEYLIKHYVLFPEDDDFWTMLVSVYNGLHNDTRLGEWYADVDMNLGVRSGGGRRVFESLMAFYPGMQVLLGELSPAARTLNSFFIVREYLGFLPERFNYGQWQVDGVGAGHHPLRPELLESCYFLHRATHGLGGIGRNNSAVGTSTGWLWAADFSLHTLQDVTHAKCGYASIKGLSPSTTGSFPWEGDRSKQKQHLLENEMPSFFLSETLKYLYLVFEDDNILHTDTEREWVFTTEAHPIHNVAAGSSKKTNHEQGGKGEGEKETLEAMSSRLESRIQQRITKRRELVEIRRPVMTAALDSNNKEKLKEKWAEMSPSSKYSDQLKKTKQDTVKRKRDLHRLKTTSDERSNHLKPLDFQQPFLGPLHPAMMEYESPTDEENLAHVGFEYHGLGNGASLMKSCPNFHNSALLWVRALNGGAVDYSERYVSSVSNDLHSEALEGLWWMSALDAAAHFGTGSYLGMPPDGYDETCQLSSDGESSDGDASREHDETSGSSSETSKPPAGAERVAVGGVGEFDIAIFDGGAGFYTRHVGSDETVSATFHAAEDAEFVMVYMKTPAARVEPERDEESQRQGLVGEGSSPASWRTSLKSIFNRSREERKTELKRRQQYDRRVAFTDSNSDTFMCSVSMVKKKYWKLDTGIVVENEELLQQFPCAPALFGQTQIHTLMKTGGLQVEGEIRPPLSTDPRGCDKVEGGTETDDAVTGTIQMMVRGNCTFERKAANHRSANAVIVINTLGEDLFLMSGGNDDDYSKEYDIPPAVLVVGEDGKEIQRLLEEHPMPSTFVEGSGETSESVIARIRLTPQDGEIGDGKIVSSKGGTVDWPVVISQQDQIRVFAPSGWGVQAIDTSSVAADSEENNARWQLFLLTHDVH